MRSQGPVDSCLRASGGNSLTARVHWPYLAAAFASLFLLGFTDNARPPLFADILSDLTLSDSAGSLMFAATSGGVIAGSALFRWIVVRIGSLRSLQLSLLGLGAGIAAGGFSPGIFTLGLASFGLGVGLGGLAVAQNLMVEQAAPPELRRRALAGLHSLYALASLLTPLAVEALCKAGLDWRRIFFLLGVPPMIHASLCLLVRPLPQERKAPPSPELAAPKAGHLPRMAGLAFMTGCCVVAELLLSTRLPLLLEREGHAEIAALGLSAFFLCLLISRVTFSLITVRLSNQTLMFGCAATSLVLASIGLAFEPRVLPLVALSLGPFFPTAVDRLADEFPGRLGTALGVLFGVVSLMVGVAHTGVGVLTDQLDLRSALAVAPLALVGTLISLVALRTKT